MSKPVASISPGTTVNDAAKFMNHRKIRRLAGIDGGKPVGIVTMKDILQVTPAIIPTATEKGRTGLSIPRNTAPLGGNRDECETAAENLVQEDRPFLDPHLSPRHALPQCP